MEKRYAPTQQAKEKLCITVEEMSERLGICRVNAYALARSDGFPSVTIGRRILIPIASLEAYLDKQSGDHVAKQNAV